MFVHHSLESENDLRDCEGFLEKVTGASGQRILSRVFVIACEDEDRNVSLFFQQFLTSVIPSIPGMAMSVMTASILFSLACFKASNPSPAVIQ